jgi:anti-sigma regulatory factor (Ser/Thr protein kinase)
VEELALHILDLVRNSVEAGAGTVHVTVAENYSANSLVITIEDDGPGIPVPFEAATDPFFTTKGKATGLGLGLFRNAAEMMGGHMTIDRSPLGGVRVTGHFRLRHIDRRPMGDLAGVLAGIACTDPQIDLRLNLEAEGEAYTIDVGALRRRYTGTEDPVIGISRLVLVRIKEVLRIIDLVEV